MREKRFFTTTGGANSLTHMAYTQSADLKSPTLRIRRGESSARIKDKAGGQRKL